MTRNFIKYITCIIISSLSFEKGVWDALQGENAMKILVNALASIDNYSRYSYQYNLLLGELKMYTDIVLEQKAENFMRYLGLMPNGNYFTCYHFGHPILDLLFLGPLVEGIVTKVALIIATAVNG